MSTDTAQSLAEQIDALKAAAVNVVRYRMSRLFRWRFFLFSDPRAETNQSGAV